MPFPVEKFNMQTNTFYLYLTQTFSKEVTLFVVLHSIISLYLWISSNKCNSSSVVKFSDLFRLVVFKNDVEEYMLNLF
jgi:type II secretory pathway component PulC